VGCVNLESVETGGKERGITKGLTIPSEPKFQISD